MASIAMMIVTTYTIFTYKLYVGYYYVKSGVP